MSTENPFIFLIDTLFSIYIAIMLIRFILQHVGADFYNPVSQFVVKLTQPLVAPARRIIPSYKRIDLATLVLVFLLILIKLITLFAIAGQAADIGLLALRAVYDLISLTFDIFIVAMIIQAILSWVNPDPYHPVYRLLVTVTAPVLRPFQRLIPPISGIDLSVLVAIIALMFLKRLILSAFLMLL
jgi:YggT family protein